MTIWWFKAWPFGQSENPIKPVIIDPGPKVGDFRIIEMKDGAWFPQQYGLLYDERKRWLTIGRVGETLPWSLWAHNDVDWIKQVSKQKCEKIIKEYKEWHQYVEMAPESVKRIIKL